MIDLTPACQRMIEVLANVTDDQLSATTPCDPMRLSDLVQHIGGLALAFTAAARKDFGPLTDTPPVNTGELDADWRVSFPLRLDRAGRGVAGPGGVGGHDAGRRRRLPCRDRRNSRVDRSGDPRVGCGSCDGPAL